MSLAGNVGLPLIPQLLCQVCKHQKHFDNVMQSVWDWSFLLLDPAVGVARFSGSSACFSPLDFCCIPEEFAPPGASMAV